MITSTKYRRRSAAFSQPAGRQVQRSLSLSFLDFDLVFPTDKNATLSFSQHLTIIWSSSSALKHFPRIKWSAATVKSSSITLEAFWYSSVSHIQRCLSCSDLFCQYCFSSDEMASHCKDCRALISLVVKLGFSSFNLSRIEEKKNDEADFHDFGADSLTAGSKKQNKWEHLNEEVD